MIRQSCGANNLSLKYRSSLIHMLFFSIHVFCYWFPLLFLLRYDSRSCPICHNCCSHLHQLWNFAFPPLVYQSSRTGSASFLSCAYISIWDAPWDSSISTIAIIAKAFSSLVLYSLSWMPAPNSSTADNGCPSTIYAFDVLFHMV